MIQDVLPIPPTDHDDPKRAVELAVANRVRRVARQILSSSNRKLVTWLDYRAYVIAADNTLGFRFGNRAVHIELLIFKIRIPVDGHGGWIVEGEITAVMRAK